MERGAYMERWRLRTGSEHFDFGGDAGSVRLSLEGSHPQTGVGPARPAGWRCNMRTWTAAVAALAAAFLAMPPARAGKLTFEERVELTRGLMAEYATVKAF